MYLQHLYYNQFVPARLLRFNGCTTTSEFPVLGVTRLECCGFVFHQQNVCVTTLYQILGIVISTLLDPTSLVFYH